MKKNILILLLFPLALFWSCDKNELLQVDMSQYNTDDIEPNEVDSWLSESFQKPYNIEVVYRFNRNFTEVARDVAPPKLDRVKPMMEAVLNCYIKPYERVAGVKFIKTFCPKQYVLFGSVLYNSNNSVVLGTADAGRQVTLYDVNNFNIYDVNSDNGVKRKLRTIHHEFTHILNQNVIIPPAFAVVTGGDYYADWTNNTQNTATIARDLGFVSRYARMVYTEDFAEMTAHLLVMGQGWFDNYVASAPATAQAKLRLKEELVVQYFNTAFGIDFRALQREIMMEFNQYLNLSAMLDLNTINQIPFVPSADHYTTYGISDQFNTMWTNYKEGMSNQTTTSRRRYPQNMFLSFISNKKMTICVNYLNNAQTSTLQAAYDFDMEIDVANQEVKFVLSDEQGNSTQHGNGLNVALKPFFDDYMYPYFHNKVFVAAWLPEQIQASNPLYGVYGGFYEKGNPTNYYYGPIQYR